MKFIDPFEGRKIRGYGEIVSQKNVDSGKAIRLCEGSFNFKEPVQLEGSERFQVLLQHGDVVLEIFEEDRK